MTDRRRGVACVAILLATAVWSVGTDGRTLWVVNGEATSSTGPCTSIRWVPRVLFHNRGAIDAIVELRHASNDATIVSTAGTVPPRRAMWRSQVAFSTGGGTLWAEQFTVPDHVAAESRLELWSDNGCLGAPPSPFPYAKVALPVVDGLIPPGEEQTHYGIDLGGSQRFRVNVAIYNAGAVPATATISLEQPLTGCVVTSRTELIPPDTLVQIAIGAVPPCDSGAGSYPHIATVIVSEPSFSFVSSLSTDFIPGATMSITSGTP